MSGTGVPSPSPVRPELGEGLSFLWFGRKEGSEALRPAQAERVAGRNLAPGGAE